MSIKLRNVAYYNNMKDYKISSFSHFKSYDC